MISCQKCGKLNQEGNQVCENCGTNLINTQINNEQVVSNTDNNIQQTVDSLNEQNIWSETNNQKPIADISNNNIFITNDINSEQNDLTQNLAQINTNNVANENEQINNNSVNEVLNNEINTKLDKIKKTYMTLVIIGLVFSCIRIPYLLNKYLGNLTFQEGIIDFIFLVFGIISIITYIFTIVLKNNKKSKYIFGLISGILSFLTGNLFANVVGILLVFDSIYPMKHVNDIK